MVQRELPGVRTHADRVDLLLALLADVGLDQPAGEDVAVQQERMVGLEGIKRRGRPSTDHLERTLVLAEAIFAAGVVK